MCMTKLLDRTVETLQYFNFIEFVGLEKSNIARIVMGTSFEWIDIVAYIVGIVIIITIEKLITKWQLKMK